MSEKIEEMNLVALRNYACARVKNEKEWFLKCLDCKGIDGCSCGRRVRDILDDHTKPENEASKPEDVFDLRFRKAMEHEDPIKWLVEQGYYSSRASANNQFRRWNRKNDGVADTVLNTMHKKYLSESGKTRGEILIAETIARIERTFAGAKNDREKALAVLRDSDPELTGKALYGRICRWKQDHPDLEEKYKFFHACRIFGLSECKRRKVRDILMEMTNCKVDEDVDGDEVSVEDFLRETDPEIGKECNRQTGKLTIIPEPSNKSIDKSATVINPSSAQVLMQTEFGRKKQELRKRKDYISQQIASLTAQQKAVDEQMHLLDKTAELFGMRPTA